MDGPNPSKMDIKVFIPAPTYYHSLKKPYTKNEKKEKKIRN